MITKTKTNKYYQAVGRRKTSVAQVRLTAVSSGRLGKAAFTINDKTLQAYFPTARLQQVVRRPLEAVDLKDKWHISAKLAGGGIHSQAEALSHAIARALVVYEPTLKPALKTAELIKRDPRMKERRKFGLKKARKAPQWSKR